jgi:hypothetical protein
VNDSINCFSARYNSNKKGRKGEGSTAAPPANSSDLAGGLGLFCRRLYTRIGKDWFFRLDDGFFKDTVNGFQYGSDQLVSQGMDKTGFEKTKNEVD